MKRYFLFAWLSLAASASVQAATAPLVVTASPVTGPPAPQIDATAWVNQTSFFYSDLSFLNPVPFQTLNTAFFTNRASGVMLSDPGFRFDFFTNGFRRRMGSWVNEGTISADTLTTLVFFSLGSIQFQPGSWLLVSATNITSPGGLNAGEVGLVRLEGENINLPRTPIRVGTTVTNQFFFGGGFLGVSNYVNDPGVTDIYWGVGTNNQLGTMGGPLFLPTAALNFAPPFPSSPIHQVVQPDFLNGFFFTNSVIVPQFSFQPYGAFVFTNQFSATNLAIQIVLVPTNTFDTNVTTDVRFHPDIDGGATVVVGFHSIDFDIVTRRSITNSVYLTDGLAFETNTFLGRNLGTGTRRPSTFEVSRSAPFLSLFGGGQTNNFGFSPELIYNTSYLSNSVPVNYAAYAASVSSLPMGQVLGATALFDPTNFAGRVEIIGKNVNMDRTRIRAESTVIIKAENLIGGQVGQIDAPFVNLDLGSDGPALVVSNVVPSTVRRLSGQIGAYAATWENTQVLGFITNQIHFHVLIVDPAFQFNRAVVINELGLNGDLVKVEDNLNVGRRFRLEATSVDIEGGLILPFGYSLAASNFVGVFNFTNNGFVSISGAANYGTDRPLAYSNYVNHGTNLAAAQFIRSGYFENTSLLSANGGVISINASDLLLTGPAPTVVTNVSTNLFFDFFFGIILTNITTNVTVVGSTLQSSADIELSGTDLLASNVIVRAGGIGQPGTLILNLTNSLSDGGPGSTNLWFVSAGVEMRNQPQSGDLLYTHLTSVIDPFKAVNHTWAGRDLGADPAGFTNNSALGILTIDSGEQSLARFSGLTGTNALYVDYIELLNNATNFEDNTVLEVAPGMTVYFANANVPSEKLDGAAGGGFVWVSSFTGPNSSTNIVYPSGSNVVVNIALAQSKDLDSDGDGIPNADDPTPIDPEAVFLTLEYASTGSGSGGSGLGMAKLSWKALAWATSYLECADSVDAAQWRVVTTFVQGPFTQRVHFEEPISGTQMRFYRVRQVVPEGVR